jgi:beta-lactamase regulating signal transducer with metallopeptidase domain
MYELLGICLVLAALLVVNAFTSVLMAACARLFEHRLQRLPARARAEVLFAMRVGPTALAVFSVGFLLVPAYISYEPYGTNEVVSTKLGVLALISAAGLGFALWRLFRSSFATRSLLRAWLRDARQIRIEGIKIPTFRIRHPFPIIAVVGTVRPRLFIAEQVLRTLNEDELAASIAHEGGHLNARDNLKRSTLLACRNALMMLPCGRSLDRAWADAAESAADEYAVFENSSRALNLASALVKIARMVPVGARADVPLGAYLVGAGENSGVKARVRRLLEIASNGPGLGNRRSIARVLPAASLGLLALFAATLSTNPKLLIVVHGAIEHAVSLLC